MTQGRDIPGYEGKYRLYPDGRVWRTTDNTLLTLWDDPPRVTLYKHGQRYQPRVTTLLRAVFGEDHED